MRPGIALLLAIVCVLAGCGSGASTPTPAPTVQEASSPTTTESPTASPTATLTATPTATSSPTPTATLTATPAPTATPRPDIEFEPDLQTEPAGEGYTAYYFDGIVTNAEDSPVTLTLYPKLYTEPGSCDPTFVLDDPTFTVQLNPGDSWSPSEPWSKTITNNYDLENWTLLSAREGCESKSDSIPAPDLTEDVSWSKVSETNDTITWEIDVTVTNQGDAATGEFNVNPDFDFQDDDCETDLSSGPTYSISLDAGESWSPSEPMTVEVDKDWGDEEWTDIDSVTLIDEQSC